MGLLSSIGGAIFGDPSSSIKNASKASVALEREGLDYTKEVNAPMLEARNMGLSGLQQFYDPTDPSGQQAFIDQAQQSPFYQSMLQQGEESVLRNQAATGGLRSGSTQQGLAQNSQSVLQGLVNQQLQGLGSLAGANVNPATVANQYNQMGQTTAQGMTAAANAQQQLAGQTLGLGMQAASMFSDTTLKENIVKISTFNGFNIYKWDWNEIASKLGLTGKSTGVLAQEVKQTNPELIGERDGYLTVNYGGIYG